MAKTRIGRWPRPRNAFINHTLLLLLLRFFIFNKSSIWPRSHKIACPHGRRRFSYRSRMLFIVTAHTAAYIVHIIIILRTYVLRWNESWANGRRFIFIFRQFTLLPINVHIIVFDIIPKRLTLLQWPQPYETRRLWKTAVVHIVFEYDIKIERCVCRLSILVRHFFCVDRVLCAPQLHCTTKIGAYNNELIIIRT